MYVNKVFADYTNLLGSTFLLAAIIFNFQIYGDLSGYSDITIGTDMLFGIKSMRKFNVPYFIRDIVELGRDMINRGIPTGNMLAETAYIKLGWALGQTHDLEEVKNIMLTPVNSEITPREPYDGYLVYQGGVPEVESFVRRVHK